MWIRFKVPPLFCETSVFVDRYSGQLHDMPLVQAAVDPGASLKVEFLEQTLNKKPPQKLETCPSLALGLGLWGVLLSSRFGAVCF